MMMAARGFTFTGLAQECRVSRPYLAMFLSGHRRSRMIAARLTRIFRLGPKFFGGEKNELPQEGPRPASR
jgi:hypothetical protein